MLCLARLWSLPLLRNPQLRPGTQLRVAVAVYTALRDIGSQNKSWVLLGKLVWTIGSWTLWNSQLRKPAFTGAVWRDWSTSVALCDWKGHLGDSWETSWWKYCFRVCHTEHPIVCGARFRLALGHVHDLASDLHGSPSLSWDNGRMWSLSIDSLTTVDVGKSGFKALQKSYRDSDLCFRKWRDVRQGCGTHAGNVPCVITYKFAYVHVTGNPRIHKILNSRVSRTINVSRIEFAIVSARVSGPYGQSRTTPCWGDRDRRDSRVAEVDPL